MLKKDKQGTRANKSGKNLEDNVEFYLCDNFDIVSKQYRNWFNSKETETSKGTLLKNVPYINIYGGNCRGEFVLSCNGRKDIRIECRKQTVSGSVDEKFPYFFANAVTFEEQNVLLVVEGDGYKFGAKEWLRDSVNAVKHKNILMLSFEEFKEWANNELKEFKNEE